MEFKRFYFEGNEYWGYINNPYEVQLLLKAYSYEELRKAQGHRDSSEHVDPHFGFYPEYNLKYTLGDWIDENNLNEYFR